MGRITTALITTALISTGLLTLTGCTSTADPTEPPPPPPPTATASATASASTPTTTTTAGPTPPAMPDAATAHTKAGAKAFVRYFWDVVNYAQATGDTSVLAALSANGCGGCDAGISSIDRVYEAGGSITGGNATVSNLVVTFGWVGGTAVADATFDIDLAPQVVTDSSGRHRGRARRSRDRFNLLADSGPDWHVTDFRSVK